MSWDHTVALIMAATSEAGQYRAPRDLTSGTPRTKLAASNKEVISFASNDYLGLSQHPSLIRAAISATQRYGTGSGSARLIVGSRPAHTRLEQRLAQWRNSEAAILFSTGYTANLGVISTFGRHAAAVLSDELNHASIIDGCRLTRTPTEVYRHSDLADLDSKLAVVGPKALVVTDTVFSMDGDVSAVQDLAAICGRHRALLVLDDAHMVFDVGLTGELECPTLRVGTLSKTLGCIGGYVCGPSTYIDVLVNKVRPFIFTTAGTPAATAAAIAAIDILEGSEGEQLKATLRSNIDRVRPCHPSPIIPIIIGKEERALTVAAELQKMGILVPAIRPPAVAPGTSRLRLTVSAAHTPSDMHRLLFALEAVGVDAT